MRGVSGLLDLGRADIPYRRIVTVTRVSAKPQEGELSNVHRTRAATQDILDRDLAGLAPSGHAGGVRQVGDFR